jgi:hypothetical protein
MDVLLESRQAELLKVTHTTLLLQKKLRIIQDNFQLSL